MKKRLLALLLASLCMSSLVPAAFAFDPDSVLPYSESEDPLTPTRGVRQDHAEKSDAGIFEKVFGGTKITVSSPFTGKTYSVPSGYNLYHGIDVSKRNGNIVWPTVMANGVEFAILRVGYRTYGSSGALYDDPYFESYITNANQLGLPVGVYVFSQALTEEEAIEEAEFALDRIQNYDIQLPIVMDYEYFSGGRFDSGKISASQMTRNVLAFCSTIREAGYEPMLYGTKSLLTDDLYTEMIDNDTQIWLAHYTTNTSYQRQYDYWQYSESGHVAGVDPSTYLNCDFLLSTDSLNQNPNTPVFLDVQPMAWYTDAVKYVSEAGLMNGTSANTFSPLTPLTRAMLAQILYSFSSCPDVAYQNRFSDVPANKWYTDAVMWASECGIMNGYGNGKFGSMDILTREQLATVLYQFSASRDVPTDHLQNLDSYDDFRSISAYAVQPMQWAVANRIISGRTPTTLAPRGSSTRAECAQILKNYLTGVGSILLLE